MSFVTVTANLPGARRWEREQERRAQPDRLNLSQSSARSLPMLPLKRETERLLGLHALHLHARFFCFRFCRICLFDREHPFIQAYLV